jgi:acylpyruvate hydrolase
VIGKGGRDIAKDDAYKHIAGYCLALDMTGRNIQTEAKNKGHPWTVAKGYDTFCPVGTFIDKKLVKDADNLQLTLTVTLSHYR